MKTSHFAITLALLAMIAACSNPPVKPEPEPIGGREPEAAIWVLGEIWFPATVGMTFYERESDGNDILLFRAASRTDKGSKRELKLGLRKAEIDWPPADTLDLLTNEHPTRVSVRYTVHRNNSNSEPHFWLGERPDLGGIKIYSLTEEDGVVYAAGEVSMTVLRGDLVPAAHVITSIFNNVRVFGNQSDMLAYFGRVNQLLAAKD